MNTVTITLQKRIMMGTLKRAVHFDFRRQRIPRTGTTQVNLCIGQ